MVNGVTSAQVFIVGAGVNTYAIGKDLLDPHQAAQAAYEARADELILIRLDGHVGHRTDDMAAVTTYLTTVTAS
jgi:hypothetical protein